MKQVLSLALVFIIVGVLSVVLMLQLGWVGGARAANAQNPEDDAGTGNPGASPRDRAHQRVERDAFGAPAPGAVKEEAIVGDTAAKASGQIAGSITANDGAVLVQYGVAVAPNAGRVVQTGGGAFEVLDLPPGRAYMLSVAADGYISKLLPEIVVEAGRRYTVDVRLDAAVNFAGVVYDDVTNLAIQGATVTFSSGTGSMTVMSDAVGNFSLPRATSVDAVKTVTVSHPDYDTATHYQLSFTDPRDVRLALGRGKGVLIVHLRFATGRVAPSTVHAQIWQIPVPGNDQLRRDRTFTDVSLFEITGVQEGAMWLVVDFPGTGIPAQRVAFDMNHEAQKDIEVFFDAGGRLEGTLTSAVPWEAGIPVDLLDDYDHVYATVPSTAKGTFHFDDLTDGEYRVRVRRGEPFSTEHIKVAAHGTTAVVIDCDMHVLKPR